MKQHLAAIRMLCDWLVVSQVLPVNPAAAVRGPKHVVTKGSTPVLTPAEARQLLDWIDPDTLAGLRDRALFSVMLYSFARVSAVLGMRRGDYFQQGSRGWLRLHEKGGKRHDVPAHHRAAEALDKYVEAAELEEPKATLFQSVEPAGRRLTGRALQRRVVLAMIKRRAAAAGLPASTCCHTFRATGITAYLSNGGTLEHAQQIASALGHGIHTQGDSVEEARSNVKEAVACYFDDTMPRPTLIRSHFVRDEVSWHEAAPQRERRDAASVASTHPRPGPMEASQRTPQEATRRGAAGRPPTGSPLCQGPAARSRPASRTAGWRTLRSAGLPPAPETGRRGLRGAGADGVSGLRRRG